MKKVVIVTWIGVYNYGTALQSFALQYAISRLGFDVCIMDKIQNLSLVDKLKKRVRRLLSPTKVNRNSKQYRMNYFHHKFQNIVRPQNKQSLDKLIKETDVFVSGSDQIWNVTHRYDPLMFLEFAKDKKRISYATSIGTDSIPEQYKEKVIAHLKKYSKISVRESSAAAHLKSLTGRDDIETVLDPTFLLEADNWRNFAKHSDLPIALPQRYILCYFVGNNDYYRQQVRDIKEKTGIPDVIVVLLKESQPCYVDNALVVDNANPNDFVYLIDNATMVCTDSFHATALSINLSIPFVDLLRFQENTSGSQNSRIHNLLAHYNLTKRLYSDKSDEWQEPTDYKSIQTILEKDREKSIKYLSESLIS